MTFNFKFSGIILASALATLSLSKPAQAGFCGNYIQISSNAGNCDTCRLQIADNPETESYFVTANNGWEAELTWSHGDEQMAIGTGSWKRNVGHSLAGKSFDIDLNQQERRLNMIMSLPGSGPIKATYLCLD